MYASYYTAELPEALLLYVKLERFKTWHTPILCARAALPWKRSVSYLLICLPQSGVFDGTVVRVSLATRKCNLPRMLLK